MIDKKNIKPLFNRSKIVSVYENYCYEFGYLTDKISFEVYFDKEKFINFVKNELSVKKDNIIIHREIELYNNNMLYINKLYLAKVYIHDILKDHEEYHGEKDDYIILFFESAFKNDDNDNEIDFSHKIDEDEDINELDINLKNTKNNNYCEEKFFKTCVKNVVIYYDSRKISYKKIEKYIINKLKHLIYINNNNKTFYITIFNRDHYELMETSIKNINVNVSLNYGSNFIEKHNKIVNDLKNNNKGIFILYGEPGTGKTTYIRHLISLLNDYKTFIYIPIDLVYKITDPTFISTFLSVENPVFIIEDAEEFVVKNIKRNEGLVNILNIGDGLLNDIFNAQIIITFNSKIYDVDDALKRSGRLLVYHKFDKLSPQDANAVCEYYKIDKHFTESVVLANIFNDDIKINENENEKDNKIGFKK